VGAIAYISRDTDGVLWNKVLTAALGPIDFRTLADLGNVDDIEVALAWKPDPGLLATFRNLRLIVSLGMGVDHLLTDEKLPHVPIVRIMDEGLVGQMSEYAIFWALRHHRDIDKYAASQHARQWKPLDFVDTINRRVGVMGLGTIGQDTARKFATLGFPTAGWSRTARQLAGYFAGELTEFDLPLALEGSAWQLRVWAGLQGIGYGETISYGELARRIGAQPAASRAVGLANGRNPVSIIVPCHRVIGADGSLTGYGWGLERKEWLLRHEGAAGAWRSKADAAAGQATLW